MYLLRLEGTVSAGRLVEFEAFIGRHFELLKQQKGFLRATLLNARGYPAKYTTLVQWESRDDAKLFARGSALAGLLREHPFEGIYSPSRPIEAYEVVHRIVGAGKPVVAYLIDEIVGPGPGNLEQFEESRGAVYQLRKQFGSGFAISILSRFLGGANRYLIFGAFSSEGDDQVTASTPEIRRYWEEHSASEGLVVSAEREFQELVKSAMPEPI